MGKYSYTAWLLILAASILKIQAFNRSLFFRSSSFWDEPRFEKSWLSTLDIQIQGGSHHVGHDGCNIKTNILSIYGPEKVKALRNAAQKKALHLHNNPQSINFKAVADVFQTDINAYQNFTHGLFTQFHLPFIVLRLFPSGYSIPSVQNNRSKEYNPSWQLSQASLTSFLHDFDISLNRIKKTALSDATLFAGWTRTFQNTEYLDFVDLTLKTGLLFPTGKKSEVNQLFDVPFGYNGHWAIPLSGDISFGAFDWLTIGAHADSLFFFDKKRCLRMKTTKEAPSGLIALGKGQAEVHPGIVWRIGAYLKADHFCHGLSLLLAFSHEQKNQDCISPCDQDTFSKKHVNAAERFKKWHRSIFHIAGEYDFSCEDIPWGPRIGIHYDHQITGKRVFDISMLGGALGIDMNWCF